MITDCISNFLEVILKILPIRIWDSAFFCCRETFVGDVFCSTFEETQATHEASIEILT